MINPRHGIPKRYKVANRDHGINTDEIGGVIGSMPCGHPTDEYAAPYHQGSTFETTLDDGSKATTVGFTKTKFARKFGETDIVDKSARLPATIKR